MNTHQTDGVFRQLRGQVQSLWGKLTGNKAKQIKGEINKAAGSAQEGYGNLKEEARETLRSVQAPRYDDEVRRSG